MIRQKVGEGIVRVKLHNRDSLVALDLCHIFGFGHVSVVVKPKYNGVCSQVIRLFNDITKLNLDEHRPRSNCVWFHKFDLSVYEGDSWRQCSR